MTTNQAARRRRLQRGVAALEAALLMPVAIFLLLGSFETYQYFRANAIVARASFAVANGVAMQQKIFDRKQCTQSDDLCTYNTIAKDLYTPLNYEAHGGLVISAFLAETVKGVAKWTPTPEWLRAYKGKKAASPPESRIGGDTSDFPPPRVGDTLIVAETFYEYEPYIMSSKFWGSMGGTKVLYSRFFFRPRFEELGVLSP